MHEVVGVGHEFGIGACAQFITDELIHELVRTDGLRVTAPSSLAPLGSQALEIPTMAHRLDVQMVFEGTVREDDSQMRITSRLVNADGIHEFLDMMIHRTPAAGVRAPGQCKPGD